MEMAYLGIYEWVYEKVLQNIITPVFDFVVSILNIALGYVFQYILGPVLLPVLQTVFYWLLRIFEVLGAIMNYLQFMGYLIVVDCLEKAFDIFYRSGAGYLLSRRERGSRSDGQPSGGAVHQLRH